MGEKVSLRRLFDAENRVVALAYLWLVLTMGSGTGWIGFCYSVPLFYSMADVLLCQYSHDIQSRCECIGSYYSACQYIDEDRFDKKESWVGGGTYEADRADANEWKNLDRKLGIVEQYGLLGLLGSLILLYSCAIRRFFSLETLYFVVLLLCSLGNEYFTWSMVLIFTAMRYFKSSKKMDVSIVIVNYNTCNLLADCLETLYRFTRNVVFEVIVVDNASTDGSESYIRKCYPEVVWINSGENLGFGRANNLGVRQAKGEYLFFLIRTHCCRTMLWATC